MRLSINIAHHDHDYVDKRGGHVLYSYMRQAPTRAAYRLEAMAAAHQRFLDATMNDEPFPIQSGLGLLVVQRAFLAAEDLGRLLFALDDTPSWESLTSAKLDDLDDTFGQVIVDSARATRPFVTPTDEQLDTGKLDPVARAGVSRLIDLSTTRWLTQLHTVRRFWGHARALAKATMHGFPIVAGSIVVGPPPAGVLTNGLRVPDRTPWALAVLSTVDHERREVETTSTPVPLDADAAANAVTAGKTATRLTLGITRAQTSSIEGGYGASIPLDFIHRLSAVERSAVEQFAATRAKEEARDV